METAGHNTGGFSQLPAAFCVDAVRGRILRPPAGCQVQGGAMMLSQIEKASPWIVVKLQVHGWDVTCLTIESKRRVGG